MPDVYSHPFDMHGEFCLYPEDDCSEQCLWPDPDCHGLVAGDRIEIHENTFLNTTFPSVKIRAKPQDWAWMLCNRYRQPVSTAIRQSGIPSQYAGTGAETSVAGHYWASIEPFGSTLVEPYTVIRSNSCCGYYGHYLGVDPSTGQLRLYSSFNFSKTRWRIVADNDVIRIVSLSPSHYGKYLDISTTTGLAKLYANPSHTGTKWRKDLYQDGSGRYARLVSMSSGSYNGQYFTLDLQDGDVYAYWNQNYDGARWFFQNQQ